MATLTIPQLLRKRPICFRANLIRIARIFEIEVDEKKKVPTIQKEILESYDTYPCYDQQVRDMATEMFSDFELASKSQGLPVDTQQDLSLRKNKPQEENEPMDTSSQTQFNSIQFGYISSQCNGN